MINDEKHKFAFFCSSLSEKIKQEKLFIQNKALISRLGSIVRLKPQQECIFFDESKSYHVCLEEVTRDHVVAFIEQSQTHVSLTPSVDVIIPLLKKAAFEEMLYSCVEMGATTIYPVITAKVQQKWERTKDYERARNIMIAAAEQSKQFMMPSLHEPHNLTLEWLSSVKREAGFLFFDPTGISAADVFKKLMAQPPNRLVLMFGPEGDLTLQEKELGKQVGAIFCALTSTVLRAQQAGMLGLGMIRSLLN